jgi:hypothetical protein
MRREPISVLQGKARPLEAEPPEPANDGPLVAGRVRVAQQEANSEGVLQVDRGELRGGCPDERQVAAVKGAPKRA